MYDDIKTVTIISKKLLHTQPVNLTVYKSSMVSKIATVKKDKRGKIVHFVYKDQVLPNLPGLFDENCLFFFL